MVQFKDVLCMATGSQKMFQTFRLSVMTCQFDFHAESNKAITREVSTFYISFVNQINPENNYSQRFQMFNIFINNIF